MNQRRPLIAGNWKMHKTASEAVETVAELTKLIDPIRGRDVMVAPPFTALSSVAGVIGDSPICLGAQNVFWEEEGAFTGEVSPSMLVDAGCSHVIVGHSERRQYFKETDEAVGKRLGAALDHGLVPIFCIGETERERESGETFSVLDKQVGTGLEGFSLNDLETLVLAYEPVWAIGTGKTATSEQAQEVHAYLRSRIYNRFGNQLSQSVRILYGGSVKPTNISELMAMPDIDGALVGGASLKADVFSEIVNY